jgi:hypothetical protein
MTKYMLDFDRMLIIRLGYFDTEADALAWIEDNITEEFVEATGWDITFETYKSLYKPIPIYPAGDERLDTQKYGRYSGGLR